MNDLQKSRLLLGTFVTVASCLMTFYSCQAARIYNMLNFAVDISGNTVGGVGIHSVTLSPGTKSDSLEWSGSTSVEVDDPQYATGTKPVQTGSDTSTPLGQASGSVSAVYTKQICSVSFGGHEQIVGGNYMVISSQGSNVSCWVCDAGHNVVAQSSGSLSSKRQPYNSQYYRSC